MHDLTLISCSYNTPKITETMLKSFKMIHPELSEMNLILMENSTNEETQLILDKNFIPYIKNPGGTHSRSIDIAFSKCKTKYALIVDTDIIFEKSISPLYDMIKTHDIDLIGIQCGDRGGYRLMPRIHPWFMFVNIEKINDLKIKFHDEERITKSGSSSFYNNIPLNSYRSNNPMYDVGSTFYEDASKAGLKISNTPIIQNWFKHYEGSSWQRVCGNPGFVQHGNNVWQEYQKEIDKVKDIDIREFYI